MTINADAAILLLDTSAAVALVVEDHSHHETTMDALAERTLGLAGHAAFETFSVLTRLPAPGRLTAPAAGRLLAGNFPASRFLGATRAAELLAELTTHRVAGGSVYDALVGATAREHRLPLVSRDRRAARTYLAVGVEAHLLP